MRNFITRAKALIRILLGKDIYITTDVRRSSSRFGSQYGGWHVLCDDINSDSVVYSFGIGEDASFDIQVIDKFGLTVHAFDPTPRSIDWVAAQSISERFVMHPVGIASFDGEVSFNPPENPEHVSHTMLDRPETATDSITVPVQTLDSILQELGHDRIDVLKLDIEGAEYDVIADIVESKMRPRQFLVEFHTRFPGVGKEKTARAIEVLRTAGYALFHVSPNNEEFCFVYDPAG